MLLVLAYLVRDKDVSTCLLMYSFIYLFDTAFGVRFQEVPVYYISVMVLISLQAVAALVLNSYGKITVIHCVLMVMFLLNFNEHSNEYRTTFYPYLDYLNYWSGELLTIIITWNVKWRKYDYKRNNKSFSN